MKNSENTNSLQTQAITLDCVSVEIGNIKILDEISLSIEQNSIFGILGPNGAGKSTLISIVVGLSRQSKGNVSVFGHSLPSRDPSIRQQIGVVLQETSLYEELTVSENLLFYASLYHVPNPKKRMEEVLTLLGLSDRVNNPVRILSGGLKRRTAIARALLHDPKLLVVDEPTLGVDVETRHTIWSHLKNLRSQGHTVLIASNYLDEAQAICDTVSVLHKGKLLVTDTPESLIAKTGHSLDIECQHQSAEKIASVLAQSDNIVRTEETLSGLSVFIKGESVPDSIINTVLKTAPITGFRFRPADLAEMFHTLEITTGQDLQNPSTIPSMSTKNFFARHPVLTSVLAIFILGIVVILEVWFSQPK